MRVSKDQGISGIVASLISLPVLGVLWIVIQPFLKSSISTALAQDIKTTVQAEVSPIKGGISVIIRANIIKLKKEIAELERLRSVDPQKWTSMQASDLVDKQTELEAQQMALGELH